MGKVIFTKGNSSKSLLSFDRSYDQPLKSFLLSDIDMVFVFVFYFSDPAELYRQAAIFSTLLKFDLQAAVRITERYFHLNSGC